MQLVKNTEERVIPTLAETIADRVQRLTEYQNADYASVYQRQMERLCAADPQQAEENSLRAAVAFSLYKLMSYKDEYEVARLYTDGEFLRKLEAQFEGDYELRFNMAPPLFSKRDPNTGHLLKSEFGPWMMKSFGLLAKLKFLRGTALDVFGYSAERKQEQADISEYQALVETLVDGQTDSNYDTAVELATLPEKLRGYGHVKDRNREKMEVQKKTLLAKFSGEEDASVVKIFNVA